MEDEVGHELYRIGDLTLDVGARLLTRGGELVSLPPKTFELFVELVRRAPGVVRRQELLDTVWAHELVNDEALTQRVMLLRRALQDDPKDPHFIASAPRWGYRLVAPVERVAPAPADRPPARPQPEGSRAPLGAVARSIAGQRFRWLAWSVAALAAALAVVVVILVLGRRSAPINSVAIAPFTPIGSASEDEVLCSGIPATLTATLAQVPELRVIASGTMSRFRGGRVDPQAVGRKVGVGAVLTGTLLRRGDDLQVTAELVNVADARVLWTDRYVRRADDIFAMQEEIARKIAGGLKLTLPAGDVTRLARRRAANLAAYELYLSGRQYWNERAESGFGNAIASFHKAIEADPSYALAYSGLADSYALQSAMEYGVVAPAEAMPRARAAAEKALAIDPGLAEAHASVGLVLWLYDFDRAGAEREFRWAIALSPGYATAFQWLGEMLVEEGRSDEAWAEIRRAEALDPLSPVIAADIGLLHYYGRDYESAIRHYLSTLATDPEFGQAALGLGLAYLRAGRTGEGVELLQGVNRAAPESPPTLAALGYALATAGRRDEALAVLDHLRRVSKQRFVPSYYVAGVYLGLGDRERAFEWFGRACAERSSLLGTVKVDPAFDPVRDDARFSALLRCAKLSGEGAAPATSGGDKRE
ncbi:MAG TPA: tetratricopeptide repeat protein [Thermoanaerobaculaceae bacterium]|nr:tetratricopeptide repeat protein [Thermoanaerobaculaceae bacterium]